MTYQHALLAQADLMAVLNELYDSEINVSISCFWDGGWDVKIGDERNGFKAHESFAPKRLHQAGRWLADEAMALYPGSKFALLYRAAMTGDPS